MSQWYPKICAYDEDGWHPTPYVGREFYGVWGNFDVKISIDKRYILGGTGYLQNPQEIGYGYELPGQPVKRPAGEKLTWHFMAPQVHDFMWAADPEYIHRTLKIRDSIPATKTSPALPALTLHLLYKPTNEKAENWEKYYPTPHAPYHLLKNILVSILISNIHLFMVEMAVWNTLCLLY